MWKAQWWDPHAFVGLLSHFGFTLSHFRTYLIIINFLNFLFFFISKNKKTYSFCLLLFILGIPSYLARYIWVYLLICFWVFFLVFNCILMHAKHLEGGDRIVSTMYIFLWYSKLTSYKETPYHGKWSFKFVGHFCLFCPTHYFLLRFLLFYLLFYSFIYEFVRPRI